MFIAENDILCKTDALSIEHQLEGEIRIRRSAAQRENALAAAFAQGLFFFFGILFRSTSLLKIGKIEREKPSPFFLVERPQVQGKIHGDSVASLSKRRWETKRRDSDCSAIS